MVREAEEHAEEDRKRREAIALRNDAESMVFQAEKTLTRVWRQIPVEIKTELDEKIQAVKEILDKDRENVDRLKPAYEEMVQSPLQGRYGDVLARPASRRERRRVRWRGRRASGRG